MVVSFAGQGPRKAPLSEGNPCGCERMWLESLNKIQRNHNYFYLCVLCVVGSFSLVEGPCKRYAVAPTRMSYKYTVTVTVTVVRSQLPPGAADG
jgi:hypothetical protein